MIYIFRGSDNTCSQVFDGTTLTQEDKDAAIAVVETLPILETRIGYTAVLMYDETHDVLYWGFREDPIVISLDQKLQTLVDEGSLTIEQMNDLLIE